MKKAKYEISFNRIIKKEINDNDIVLSFVSDSFIINTICDLKSKYNLTIVHMALDVYGNNIIIIKCAQDNNLSILSDFSSTLGDKITNCRMVKRIF